MRNLRTDTVMLKFEKLTRENLEQFKPYFAVQNTHIGDYSLGFQFMWHKYLAVDYAFCGDCLLLHEFYAGKDYFYYPISLSSSGEQERAAVEEIERYCRDREVRLHYTNVPRYAVPWLLLRYDEASHTNVRRWRDYLYSAESFQAYAGGKYAGQRNHVNKFKKLYPDWQFRPCTQADLPALNEFLGEFERVQREKHDFIADAELNEVYEILPQMEKLDLFAGMLLVGGKVIAFSVGERCGDMIVVHIEKALRGYEGAYPMVAQQFALAFCGEGVKYLNRMDDAADPGLRKSKLQYGPVELVDKYNIIPKRAIDGISRLPSIKTARLTLAAVKDGDERYALLASNSERNRWWGYDWRQDYEAEDTPPASYFTGLIKDDFKHKREMSLGIYLGKTLVGEVVLHRFGYNAQVEVGARLLPEAEGFGYAREAIRAFAQYALIKLGLARVEAKCFKENVRSKNMLLGAGMRPCGEDETYFYFYMTAEM